MPDPPMMPSTARVMTSPSQDFAEDVRLYCGAIIKHCRAVARGLKMPTTKDREKRQSIIDACRSMNALGINQGTSGNISLRHGEGLLEHHGMIAVGTSLSKAMWLAVEVETLARQYHGCLQIGTPRLLPKAEIENVLGRIAGYGPADK